MSYLPIESIDDIKDNARVHTCIRVTCPEMPEMAIRRRRYTNYT
jgi:hypothetical protein